MKIVERKGTWDAKILFYFLGDHIHGATLFPFIFYREKVPDDVLIRHEWVHVQQVRQIGFFRFYLSYYLYYIAGMLAGQADPYRQNPWEVEAYAKQSEAV